MKYKPRHLIEARLGCKCLQVRAKRARYPLLTLKERIISVAVVSSFWENQVLALGTFASFHAGFDCFTPGGGL